MNLIKQNIFIIFFNYIDIFETDKHKINKVFNQYFNIWLNITEFRYLFEKIDILKIFCSLLISFIFRLKGKKNKHFL